MKRIYSLALHDIRVSEGENSVKTIKHVMDLFEIPLTVHLIFDKSLENEYVLLKFILENLEGGKLEIVFHGLSHQCSGKVSGTLAFYHKYQAEYLDDSEMLREKTKEMYNNSKLLLGSKLGICPPCWIAIKKNLQFFQTLEPLFVEKVLSISFNGKKHFSTVISLGSPGKIELVFLKILAWLMFALSIAKRRVNLRIAVHPCDLEKPASMAFFSAIVGKLERYNFQPVLLKEMK
jgi:hypothetical protein